MIQAILSFNFNLESQQIQKHNRISEYIDIIHFYFYSTHKVKVSYKVSQSEDA